MVASRLPDPLENPDGWNLTPEVVMQLQSQPTVRRAGGGINNGTAKEIVLKASS